MRLDYDGTSCQCSAHDSVFVLRYYFLLSKNRLNRKSNDTFGQRNLRDRMGRARTGIRVS
jgi:hypothetical protein